MCSRLHHLDQFGGADPPRGLFVAEQSNLEGPQHPYKEPGEDRREDSRQSRDSRRHAVVLHAKGVGLQALALVE